MCASIGEFSEGSSRELIEVEKSCMESPVVIFSHAMKKAKPVQKEVVRATFSFHGAELRQIREVRDMLSLNSELDAARYLMQRGLEVLTPVLTSRRTQTEMAAKVAPEALVQAMIGSGVFNEEQNAKAEKLVQELKQ